MADLVAVVKMISARIIEIYGLFDETQTDDALVELQIARGFSRNGCNMIARSTGQCNTACSLSAGVWKPKVFRGR